MSKIYRQTTMKTLKYSIIAILALTTSCITNNLEFYGETVKVNYAILSVFSMFFLFACQSAKKETESIVINIDINKSQNRNVTEFIDSIRFIKLETTDYSLMQGVTKVYFDDQKLIIFDYQQQQVLVFQEDGTLINKIRNVGQGYGEYVGMRIGFYNSDDKKIIIFGANKLLYYALDGTLIKEILGFGTETVLWDMVNLPNGNLLCYAHTVTQKYAGKKSGLWEADTDRNFVRNIFTIEEVYPIVTGNSHFQLLPKNKIMFRDALFNGIHYLENGELRKFISYEIKDDIVPKFRGVTYAEGENFIKSITAQESENYIFTYWLKIETNRNFYTVFNKETGESILVAPSDVFWQGVVKPMYPCAVVNNRLDILVTVLSGNEILDYLNAKDSNPVIKNQLRELIEGMSEGEILTMNPVLQLLYVK